MEPCKELDVDGGFPAGFMDGTAASILDWILAGGDLCEPLGLAKDEAEMEDPYD